MRRTRDLRSTLAASRAVSLEWHEAEVIAALDRIDGALLAGDTDGDAVVTRHPDERVGRWVERTLAWAARARSTPKPLPSPKG